MNSQSVLVSLPVYTKILDIDNDKLKKVIQNHRSVFEKETLLMLKRGIVLIKHIK